VRTASGEVGLDDISQGMSSVFNWLGVLIQRLHDVYPDAERPEDESAVVLIDEVDAHLHPEWQRRLVEIVKQALPRLQIIATSHSPLLAGALNGREIRALKRGKLSRVGDSYGLRTHDILTGAIFDLDTDRNPEVERKIGEFLNLYQTVSTPPEKRERMETLAQELKGYNYQVPLPEDEEEDAVESLSEEQLQRVKARFGASPSE
jgi:predicted ATP-binding protein involved in virulence